MTTYFQDAGYDSDMIFAYKGDNAYLKGTYLVLLRDNGTEMPLFTVEDSLTDSPVRNGLTGMPFAVHISDVRPVNWPYTHSNSGPRQGDDIDTDKEHMRSCLIVAMELLERMPKLDTRPDQEMLRDTLDLLDPSQHFREIDTGEA